MEFNTVLQFGATYFTAVEKLAKLIGQDQASYDAAEIFYFIYNYYHRSYKATRKAISDCLYFQVQKVDRAIKLLKSLNLISEKNKVYIPFGNSNISEDLLLSVYLISEDLNDWYKHYRLEY